MRKEGIPTRSATAFLLLLLFLPSPLPADEVRLKDGTVIEGKIKVRNAQGVRIEKQDGSMEDIPADRIAGLKKGRTSWEIREKSLEWYEKQKGSAKETWQGQVSFARQCASRSLKDKEEFHLNLAYEMRKAETADDLKEIEKLADWLAELPLPEAARKEYGTIYESKKEEAGEDAGAHFRLGEWCMKRMMKKEAEESWFRALDLAPEDKKTRERLINLLRKECEGLRYFGYYEREAVQEEENTEIIGPGGLDHGLVWVEKSILSREGRGKTPYKLYPDWQKRLKTTCESYRSQLGKGKILGFCLGDELVWHGLPLEDVHRVSDFIRNLYPDPSVIIYYNECQTPVFSGRDMFKKTMKFTIPKSLSWFSLDIYRGGNENRDFVNGRVRNLYENRLYPMMHPHQKAACVPGCFGVKGKKELWDELIAKDARDFYEWALEDLRIVAIFPWGRVSYGGIDLKDLPKASKAWRETGLAISSGRAIEERLERRLERRK